jgi:hypothetical protein
MKYCDVVMKGGITSGIVYPNAVLTLAKEFRFKSVGGTSAGAIAAAVTAAAALGDRRGRRDPALAQDRPELGFDGMSRVAAQLATQGFIHRLFQPARGARNAFRTLVCMASTASRWRKAALLLTVVPITAPLEFLVVLAGLLALAHAAAPDGGLLAVALPALFCAFAVATVCAIARVARVVRGNLLGLCSGMPVGRDDDGPALTSWLHRTLQSLAGQDDGKPLTFEDLRTAPRYDDEPRSDDAIVLRMITTGVSHREPRTLPFRDVRFWFLREEFDRLFPREVVDWMVANSGAPPDTIDGKTYYPLPADDALPVIVATRLSLSFPFLVSAVPLHEPARRKHTEEGQITPPEKNVAESTDNLATGGEAAIHGERTPSTIAQFRTCWFSDGGISSNFPIHLFDAAMPSWPTFAIDLVYPGSDDIEAPRPDPVFLPDRNAQGWQRTYQRIGGRTAVGELAGFLFGIVATMQNWRDLLQARAPGHRDRIVHVALEGDEGGLNLDMPQPVLQRIADMGTPGGALYKRFSFANHYWMRWLNLASALQRYTGQVAAVAKPEHRVTDYADVYALVESEAPDAPSYPVSQFQAAVSLQMYRQLVAQGEAWADTDPDLTQGAPRPLPQMKITPIY